MQIADLGAVQVDVKAEKVVLDGVHLKKLIDDYMPALYSHLVNEIDTLIGLEKYDDKVDWVTWFNGEVEKLNKGFMGQSDFRVSVIHIVPSSVF